MTNKGKIFNVLCVVLHCKYILLQKIFLFFFSMFSVQEKKKCADTIKKMFLSISFYLFLFMLRYANLYKFFFGFFFHLTLSITCCITMSRLRTKYFLFYRRGIKNSRLDSSRYPPWVQIFKIQNDAFKNLNYIKALVTGYPWGLVC